MQATAEELEVVRKDDEGADGDEGEQPRHNATAPATPIAHAAPIDTAAIAMSARRGIPVPSGRPLSSSSACAPMPTARKKATSAATSRPGRLRSERGADRDVAQVPDGVRRMQERDVLAQAAGRERVERGPSAGALGHRRRPQTTIPPPRLRRRCCTSSTPAARQRPSNCSIWVSLPELVDARPEEVAHLAPASRDQPPGERQPDARVRAPERSGKPVARNTELEPGDRPPGRTTRDSSDSVAPGSST